MICYYGMFPISLRFSRSSPQSILVNHHYPYNPNPLERERMRPRRKMNTKRINYLIKMISPLGRRKKDSLNFFWRKVRDLSLSCHVRLSFYSTRISFSLINYYVEHYYRFSSCKLRKHDLLSTVSSWISVRTVKKCTLKNDKKTFVRGDFVTWQNHGWQTFPALPSWFTGEKHRLRKENVL